MASRLPSLADAIDRALPQTQCRRCGFDDCRAYAEAIATAGAPIDRCPPGGAEGVSRLAQLTGRPVVPLDPAHGSEGPRRLALIDEAACIGCTLCLKACPVDCIVGAAKLMHTVVAAQCTGCELCLPACPVDCIALVQTDDRGTGWAAWSPPQAEEARSRYTFHRERLATEQHASDARLAAAAPRADPAPAPGPALPGAPPTASARSRTIDAVLARARAR